VTKSERKALAALAVVGVAAAYVLLKKDAKAEGWAGDPPVVGTAVNRRPLPPPPPQPEPTILERATSYVGDFLSFLTASDEATAPTGYKDPTQWRNELKPLFRRLETSYAMPPGLLEAVADRESRFRNDIITGELRGKSGEVGIMQLLPQYHLSSDAERLDPQVAIPYAALYLAKNFMKFGTWEEAIAAYNWGPGNVERSGIQAAPKSTKEYIAWVQARGYVEGFV